MSAFLDGLLSWELQRDKDGHRTYTALWQVRVDDVADGPFTVMNCPELPGVGSYWAFGNDVDGWAYCWPNWKVTPVVKKEITDLWTVEQTFTTLPLNRCQDNSIENPLEEPPQIRGSFQKKSKLATKDRNGDVIKNSAHEEYGNKQVEFDENMPQVQIAMNLVNLPLSTFSQLIDHVNDQSLWGLEKRMIKLSNATWERRLFGTCSYFYTVQYDFDINYATFDRKVIDRGRKYLAAGGDPDDPADFIIVKDKNGDNTPSTVLLDGAGGLLPAGQDPIENTIEYYQEANLLDLGIPASLE